MPGIWGTWNRAKAFSHISRHFGLRCTRGSFLLVFVLNVFTIFRFLVLNSVEVSDQPFRVILKRVIHFTRHDSKLKTFVWILNHISRSITWSLCILKESYLVNMVFHMVVSVYRLVKILKLVPVPWRISERLIELPVTLLSFGRFIWGF